MSEAYKVSVRLELEDKFSPDLAKAVKALKDASDKLGKFPDSLKEMSKKGESLAEALKKAADAGKEFGKEEGFAAAVKNLEKMVSTSDVFAKNMQAALRAGEHLGSQIPRRSSLHSANLTRSGSRESEAAPEEEEKSGKKQSRLQKLDPAITEKAVDKVKEGGHWISEKAREAIKEGLKSNFSLEDINTQTSLISNVKPEDREKTKADLKTLEIDAASKYGYATKGDLEQFADARGEVANSQDSMKEQNANYASLLPYAVAASKEQGTQFLDAFEGFLKIDEKAGAESPEEKAKLNREIGIAMHATGASLDNLSSVLVDAHEALEKSGENRGDAILLLATLAKQGLAGSSTVDLLDTMAKNPMPSQLTGNSAEEKEKREAGRRLGLYDEKGEALFYKNGHADLMQLMSLLASAQGNLGREKFAETTNSMFGKNNEIAASLTDFFDHATDGDAKGLGAMRDTKQNANYLEDALASRTSNEKIDLIKAKLNIAMVNSTTSYESYVNKFLDVTLKFTDGLDSFTHNHQDLSATILGTVGAFTAIKKVTEGWKFIRSLLGEGTVGTVAEAGEAGEVASASGAVATTAAAGTGVAETAAVGTEVALAATEGAGAAAAVETGALVVAALDPILWVPLLAFGAYELLKDDKDSDKIPHSNLPDSQSLDINGSKGLNNVLLGASAGSASQQIDEMKNRQLEVAALEKLTASLTNWQPVFNANVYVDSQQIASRMVPSMTNGPSGINSSAARLGPGISNIGFAGR